MRQSGALAVPVTELIYPCSDDYQGALRGLAQKSHVLLGSKLRIHIPHVLGDLWFMHAQMTIRVLEKGQTAMSFSACWESCNLLAASASWCKIARHARTGNLAHLSLAAASTPENAIYLSWIVQCVGWEVALALFARGWPLLAAPLRQDAGYQQHHPPHNVMHHADVAAAEALRLPQVVYPCIEERQYMPFFCTLDTSVYRMC